MIMDELLEFADGSTDVQAATGTALIGDVIDLGATEQDFGSGEPMYLVIQIDTAITSSGSGASVAFQVASDSAAAVATNGEQSIHAVTDAIEEATLVAGFELVIPMPIGVGVPYERYLGVQAVIAGETVTAGAVSAFLTKAPKKWVSYPDATN